MSSAHFSEPFAEIAGHGEGFQEVVVGASPAAGVDFVLKMAGQYITRPIAVTFQLVTSGVAGNRLPEVTFETSDGKVFGLALPVALQITGQTILYSAVHGGGALAYATQGRAVFVLPGIFLEPGHVLAIRNVGADAADQLSAVTLVLDRYLTRHERARRHRAEQRRHEHGPASTPTDWVDQSAQRAGHADY